MLLPRAGFVSWFEFPVVFFRKTFFHTASVFVRTLTFWCVFREGVSAYCFRFRAGFGFWFEFYQYLPERRFCILFYFRDIPPPGLSFPVYFSGRAFLHIASVFVRVPPSGSDFLVCSSGRVFSLHILSVSVRVSFPGSDLPVCSGGRAFLHSVSVSVRVPPPAPRPTCLLVKRAYSRLILLMCHW